jgi:hypothetical protein
MRSVGLFLIVAVALVGCSSEPAQNDPAPTARGPDDDIHSPTSGMGGSFVRAIFKDAAEDLRATERFKADVLDVRGLMDRSGHARALNDGEPVDAELRRALASAGLHVIARADPKPSERAAVAIPVYGFIDEDPAFTQWHFEAAVESPTSAGPARVVWAYDRWVMTSAGAKTSPLKIDELSIAAAIDLAKNLSKDDAVQVLPVTDRTGKFPVLAFDACFRARLVRRGVPVVWRRAAGVDAPIGMGAATSPEKRVDLPAINGEVTEAPGGGAILTLKLERVNPATKKLEIVAQFDRKLP